MTLFDWICIILFLFLLAAVCAFYWREVQGERRFRQRVLAELAAIPKTRSEEISDEINSEEYLTAEQVAKMLQVSKTTIYSWAYTGYLPALKIRGGSRKNVWRFSRREMEDWIAHHKKPATAKDLFASKGEETP